MMAVLPGLFESHLSEDFTIARTSSPSCTSGVCSMRLR